MDIVYSSFAELQGTTRHFKPHQTLPAAYARKEGCAARAFLFTDYLYI